MTPFLQGFASALVKVAGPTDASFEDAFSVARRAAAAVSAPTENQHGVNPHDGLDPKKSAEIIINHVSDGLRRAARPRHHPGGI